ncbi:hypothetical protein B0I35DRAFT_424268 [Stachybotrys elegans]|uniref:Transcription initiation factor TFIID subunit 8 n=1 Tax=Stachybotrys elegans TaxID=80388 RepID=A0A8K0SVH9_9HYPO|nr:hypothetical protein B0I35DRAFT_424268 [Stachybotrys elegans]
MTEKHSLSPSEHADSDPDPKRLKSAKGDAIDGLFDELPATKEEVDDCTRESCEPTQHHLARRGIQRAIAMVLKYDGFASATPEAMEDFTSTVEAYLESLIEETKTFAIASRREHPIPTDFEITMRRFNLPMSSLKPHLKHPIPKQDVLPEFANLVIDDQDAHATLPLLGQELSGQPDKDDKQYIPASFPDFPSRHTYRFTPQEDTSVRDPKQIREDAARTAAQGEEALRGLVRASKMRKQKEAKTLVETDTHGKERFRLWESTMKRLMSKDGRTDHADQVEIADHSMIVNGEGTFARKEVSRHAKRAVAASGGK